MANENDSIWKNIYLFLKENEIDVYSQGQYEGECKEPYVVLSDGGTANVTTNVSSVAKYYTVMCYVPFRRFSELEPYVTKVKGIMKELFPLIRPDGVETPATLDEELAAHMVSVEYINYRKLNYL